MGSFPDLHRLGIPNVTSEGVARRNSVVSEAAALDSGHNPGGDQRLDKRCSSSEMGAYRIKERLAG